MNIILHTNHGPITITLYPEKAPKTVENFLEYINAGHYDGTLFHRVIDGFMIQGGGFLPKMSLKETHEPITNEADNKLSNKIGTIAMARTTEPHSATAQFFINVHDNIFLDHQSKTPEGWGYCVFGKVIEGMSAIKTITKVTTATQHNHQDVPKEDVIIERVEVVESA